LSEAGADRVSPATKKVAGSSFLHPRGDTRSPLCFSIFISRSERRLPVTINKNKDAGSIVFSSFIHVVTQNLHFASVSTLEAEEEIACHQGNASGQSQNIPKWMFWIRVESNRFAWICCTRVVT
jgi:hypothetical protein